MNEMNDMNEMDNAKGFDVPSFAELYRTSKVMHEMNKKMNLVEELLEKHSQIQDCRQERILREKICDEFLKVIWLKSLLECSPVQYVTIF